MFPSFKKGDIIKIVTPGIDISYCLITKAHRVKHCYDVLRLNTGEHQKIVNAYDNWRLYA